MLTIKQKHIIVLPLFLVKVCLTIGCDSMEDPPDKPIPENMVVLSPHYGDGVFTGTFHTALWSGNRIYASSPLRYYELDVNFSLVHDSVLLYEKSIHGVKIGFTNYVAMRFNSGKSKLLCVKSQYHDVSLGNLEEINLKTLSKEELLDSTHNISLGVYLNDDSIVYYSYGSYSESNQQPVDAGYYLFEKRTCTKHFLLHHISPFGPNEILNGFDVSPDRSHLIIPSVAYGRSPIIIEFDLTSRQCDTLNVEINTSQNRWCLFLRYNRDGKKILYNSYPTNSLNSLAHANDGGEIGIIDKSTLTKSILSTNPFPDFSETICIFPDWSTDERSLVYGSAPVSIDGRVANYYQVTILKSIR